MSLKLRLASWLAGADHVLIHVDDLVRIKAKAARPDVPVPVEVIVKETNDAVIAAHVDKKLAQEEKLAKVTPWDLKAQTAKLAGEMNSRRLRS